MRRQYVPVIMFIAFGYVITAPAALLLGVFGDSLNLYIRSAEAGLLLFVILFSISSIPKKNKVLLPLIIFLLIYSLRIVNDVLLEGILMIYQTPAYVLGYFFGLTLLPVIAIALLYRHQDSQNVFRHAFAFLIIANVALFFYAITSDGFDIGNAFSGRIQESGVLEGSATLNPIWFGWAGASLASMLIGLFAAGHGFSMVKLGVGTALFCLCVTNILFGASRGPLLGLIITFMMLIFRPGAKIRGYYGAASRGKTWILSALVVGIAILIASSEENVFLIERMFSLYADRIGGSGGFEERDVIYAAAWQDFISSPLFGSSYVVSYQNSSPHNIILESLIATGLVGTFVLFVALFLALKGMLRLMDGRYGFEGVSLALLTSCSIVVGFTSSSIGQSPHLWIFIALVTVMAVSDMSARRHI